MDGNSNDKESLLARIQQLEQERDELRKDIEQLCIQQAGPSYLVVATRMHFQRTAGLEQEIENLKKKLIALTRDNQNLQEELSEAYRIKGQLADLHGAEVAKNAEAEKQLKFFQGCVAAAFAERDQSVMEAEKAKEKEELVSQKLNDFQKRLDETMSDCFEQKRCNDLLQIELSKHEGQNKAMKKITDKFFKIKQRTIGGVEDLNWDDKFDCLLNDPDEMWSFNDSSLSKYISSLEEELERLRSSVDNLQNKLRMGLEIESHLKKKVHELEKKRFNSNKMILEKIAELRHFHSQNRTDIVNMLDEARCHVKSTLDVVEAKLRQADVTGQNLGPQSDLYVDECHKVHITIDAKAKLGSKSDIPGLATSVAKIEGDASEALAQALQEKVAALLLLSQQEERHLLDRNVNATLQKKLEELQRNLLQVTNEKVKALVELAQIKQKYHLLQEHMSNKMKQGNAEVGAEKITTNERDGRLRNLLKRTYLKRWVGAVDVSGNDAEANLNSGGNSFSRFSNMDIARMKIENVTLKESMESMEHLTSSIHRLRLSLLKVKASITIESEVTSVFDALDEIISEAKLVRTALGSSLPISWSAEADAGRVGEVIQEECSDALEEPGREKMDAVSSAGFEMVELLIIAAQILRDSISC